MQKIFLTFFYSGLLKPAPGTWGSIAGAIPGILILYTLGDTTLFLASILLFLVSIKIIDNYEKNGGEHDTSSIVIDEVAGVWLAISISSNTWLQMILSVIFFRMFDILKPSIIGKIDRDVKGGLGVMGDDMVAGAFGGLLSAIIYYVLTKFTDFTIF